MKGKGLDEGSGRGRGERGISEEDLGVCEGGGELKEQEEKKRRKQNKAAYFAH